MIVVTGAKGIVGRVIVDMLSREGVDVFAISREKIDLAAGIDLVSLVPSKPSAVIHLAAAVPHSLRYPDNKSSGALTVEMDRAVYKAVREWDCRVVYASTCSLYDKKNPDVKTEGVSILPRLDSPYMQAKYKGEQLFSKLASYAILRLPAPIGPGLPDTVVAKRFFDLAMSDEKIQVWGSGSREQNYVDVQDIGLAFLAALESNCNGTFNVAAHAPVTMLELARVIVNTIRSGSYGLVDKQDPSEPEYTRYSNLHIYEKLGWRPRITLTQSVEKMVAAL